MENKKECFLPNTSYMPSKEGYSIYRISAVPDWDDDAGEEGHIKGKPEINDGISFGSIQEGVETIAGLKGFSVFSCDSSKKEYTLDSTEGLEIGDIYSVRLNSQEYDCGQIIEIKEGTVVVDKLSQYPLAENNNFLFILKKPHIGTIDLGLGSHAEGWETQALYQGHSEGYGTYAYGRYAHAEGFGSKAGYSGHSEGRNTEATGEGSHAEGVNTKAIGNVSHAEGQDTQAEGSQSHAEGHFTDALGLASHAEGKNTTAQGNYSHSEGIYTQATGEGSHAEGDYTQATGAYAHSEGGRLSSNGQKTVASGDYSHAEGRATKAKGISAHTEGSMTSAEGENAHAEGGNTSATGKNSHAEGHYATASGVGSHAENNGKALGKFSHAEGQNTTANGEKAHAEGFSTSADGQASHAEGSETKSVAVGSHTEGGRTQALANYSHAEGYGTITNKLSGQHVQGRFNEKDEKGQHAHIVGWGKNEENRKNIHTLSTNGDAWFSGNVFVGQKHNSKKLALEEDLTSLEKKVANIEYVNEGNSYIFVEDNSIAYQKKVPTGVAPNCMINNLGSVIYEEVTLGENLFNGSLLNGIEDGGLTFSYDGETNILTINGTGNTSSTNFLIIDDINLGEKEALISITTIGGSISEEKGVRFAFIDSATDVGRVILSNAKNTYGKISFQEQGIVNAILITGGIEGVVFNNYQIRIEVSDEYSRKLNSNPITEIKTVHDKKTKTIKIPQEIQNLDGYGLGINYSIYNYIDFEEKVFIRNVKMQEYKEGDRVPGYNLIIGDNKVVYELRAPEKEDISQYLTFDGCLEVQAGDTIIFENERKQRVLSEILYQVKINNLTQN